MTADTSSQASQVRGAGLPFARYGLTGSFAARFLIYQRREPTSLIYWGIIAVVMVVVSFRVITTPAYLGGILFAIGLGAAMTGVFHANSIGLTGPGFGSEAAALTARRELRAYFCGQNIALAAVGIPLLAVFSFGLMAVAGHPVDGFLALAVGIAALGTALGLSNIFSVVAPYPMERRIGSPVRRAAEGYAGQSLAATFGSLLGVGICAIPVVVAVELTGSATALVRMPRPGGRLGRVRDRARLGRTAHRRQRGRTKAARAVPGRHPQQALTGPFKRTVPATGPRATERRALYSGRCAWEPAAVPVHSRIGESVRVPARGCAGGFPGHCGSGRRVRKRSRGS